jgi:tetratricopeptide (TPR) repeat protein
VQDEIASMIVSKLRIELAPQDQRMAMREKAPTQNVEAYELYLQGRSIWKRRGEDNLRRAIDLYQQALGLDPGFARAHAALASAYVVMPGYTRDPDDDQEFIPLAVAAARQALSIDPNIGEAHAVLAQISAGRGDLLDAESGFFFAISLEPHEPTPHHWYSLLLNRVGRLDAALDQARRAHELDPTSPALAANLAGTYLVKGDDEQALRYSRLALDLGLGKKGDQVAAAVAVRRGEWADARRLFVEQEAIPAEIRPHAVRYVDALADPALRSTVVAELRAIDPKIVPQASLIEPYLQLGEVDLAYEILFEEIERDPAAWAEHWNPTHAWSPEGAAFRKDPRFVTLAERIGIVDYWKQYGYPDGCRAGRDTPIVCS